MAEGCGCARGAGAAAALRAFSSPAGQLRGCSSATALVSDPGLARRPSQVTIFKSAGLPYVRHVGGLVSGVILRADPDFSGSPRFDDVSVR